MKKFKLIILSFILIFMWTIKVEAKNVDVYLFHSDTCPHCAEEREYLEEIKDDMGINIHYYEVSKYPNVIDKVRDKLDIKKTSDPDSET